MNGLFLLYADYKDYLQHNWAQAVSEWEWLAVSYESSLSDLGQQSVKSVLEHTKIMQYWVRTTNYQFINTVMYLNYKFTVYGLSNTSYLSMKLYLHNIAQNPFLEGSG